MRENKYLRGFEKLKNCNIVCFDGYVGGEIGVIYTMNF